MPIETLLVTIAVLAVFVGFGVTLAWADRQTSLDRPGPDEPTSKRRAV